MKKKKNIIIVAALIVVCVGIWGVYSIVSAKSVKWDKKANTSDELRQYQDYWVSGGRLMKADNGYYIIGSEGDGYNNIYYWNGESQSYNSICDKANCKHNTQECAAYFEGVLNFQYNNGYFFYTVEDDEQNTYLCRCKVDGTDRNKLLKIADYNNKDDVKVYVHYNHVFVCSYRSGLMSYQVTDYDMEKSNNYDTEVLSGENGNIVTIMDINGDNVLITSEKKNGSSADIYLYKISGKSINKIKTLNEATGFVRMAGDSIVYTSGEGNKLFKVDNPDSETLVKKGTDEQIACDAANIYIDNVPMFKSDDSERNEKHSVSIYDMSGKKLDTVDMPEDAKADYMVCFFGDNDKMFATTFSTNYFFVYDKDNIGKSAQEWKKISQEY